MTWSLLLFASLSTIASPLLAGEQEDLCSRVSSEIASMVAGFSAAAGGAGALVTAAPVAAVTHSSGALIVSSVGAGGVGFLPGTMGVVATGVAAAPFVAGAGLVGATAAVYCLNDQGKLESSKDWLAKKYGDAIKFVK